ncbi:MULTISPECIES: hypothetical protein [Glutamicibacter]|jgi:hypothetical protein|uniref:hypothetical protein n=1 Tax=Glutamicibacter TaxID=1742989 RepID=UPI00195C66D6|nr:hypothetical protein [Glutamicibacter nicotianae]MBM7769765.1 hypothetical protein [Glutamicibacter nicotianae]
MNDRKTPEEPARTAEFDESTEPGDERVVRRGEINNDPDQAETSANDDGRFDAG